MNIEKLLQELTFKAVRSSGAGGQNVNKVSSKVILTFDVVNSNGLETEEKQLIVQKLTSRLTQEKILNLNCDEDRSQLKNKEIVTKRFLQIIKAALIIPKERKPTKIPKSVIKKRLKDKKTAAATKILRQKPTTE